MGCGVGSVEESVSCIGEVVGMRDGFFLCKRVLDWREVLCAEVAMGLRYASGLGGGQGSWIRKGSWIRQGSWIRKG